MECKDRTFALWARGFSLEGKIHITCFHSIMRAPYNNDNAIQRRSTEERGLGFYIPAIANSLDSPSHLAEMQCVAEGYPILRLFFDVMGMRIYIYIYICRILSICLFPSAQSVNTYVCSPVSRNRSIAM